MNKRRAFLLIELLCVLAALCALAGTAMPLLRSGDESRIVREEAENLCAWLSSRMAQAAREDCGFKLIPIFIGMRASELKLEWQGGPRDLEGEFYSAKRADIERVSLAKEHTFDGGWFTLTPAASFIIKSRSKPEVRLYVTVSGTGYADVKETLEE